MTVWECGGYPHAPSEGLAAPLHSPRKEAPSYAKVSFQRE